MTKRAPIVVYEYPILKPFRHNGRWWYPIDKTIKLAPRQTPFLLRSGKIGQRKQQVETTNTAAVKVAVSTQAPSKSKEVKNG
ncbi:MAG: hypothetical protein ACK5MF_13525 [Vibrio sp.]|uniref:hypothetical protein n=1 Tax=Vibrio sp. TaxID=678 RepID=UPI003A86EC03